MWVKVKIRCGGEGEGEVWGVWVKVKVRFGVCG